MNDYRDGIKIKNAPEEDDEDGEHVTVNSECVITKQTASTSSNSSLSFASMSKSLRGGIRENTLTTATIPGKLSASNLSNHIKSSNTTSANSLSINSSAANNENATEVKSTRSQLSQLSDDTKALMHSSLSVDSSSQSVAIDLKVTFDFNHYTPTNTHC